METTQEYTPDAEKSIFDSWTCFSLLLSFCKYQLINLKEIPKRKDLVTIGKKYSEQDINSFKKYIGGPSKS